MEIVIFLEENLEIRKIILNNLSDKVWSIEIISYMEIILVIFSVDVVYLVFFNLFI